jgi:hypothetical protein
MHWGTVDGTPLTRGDLTLTPRSRVLSARVRSVGLTWCMPDSVLVERPDSVERLPVVDVTRLAQLAVWGLTAVAAAAFVIRETRERR